MHDERERSDTTPIPTHHDAAGPKVVVVDYDFKGRLNDIERTVALWRKVTWWALTAAVLSLGAAAAFLYDRGGDEREVVLRQQYLERRADKAEARDEAQERRLLDLERGRRRSYDQPSPSTHQPGDSP